MKTYSKFIVVLLVLFSVLLSSMTAYAQSGPYWCRALIDPTQGYWVQTIEDCHAKNPQEFVGYLSNIATEGSDYLDRVGGNEDSLSPSDRDRVESIGWQLIIAAPYLYDVAPIPEAVPFAPGAQVDPYNCPHVVGGVTRYNCY